MSAPTRERLAALLMAGALVASGLAVSGGVLAQTTAGNDAATNGTAGNDTAANVTDAPNVTDTETPRVTVTETETTATAGTDDQPTVETDVGEAIDRQELSYVRAVHASPDAPAVDVAVDNETVLTGVEFGDVSDYLTLASGPHNVTISVAEDPDTVVFDETVTVDRRSITTLVATGSVSENATRPFEVVAWPDDPWAPADNESAVSVAHLSPDTTTVDVTTDNGSVLLADDISYQNASEYVTVPPGNYTLEVRDATGTNDGEILTTVNVSLDPGTVSTAFAVGYLNPGEEPMDRTFEVVSAQDATVTIQLPPGQAATTDNETGVPAADDDGVDEEDDAFENDTDDAFGNETDDAFENETDDAFENDTDDALENDTDDAFDNDTDDALENDTDDAFDNDTDDGDQMDDAGAGDDDTDGADDDAEFGENETADNDTDDDGGIFGDDIFGG